MTELVTTLPNDYEIMSRVLGVIDMEDFARVVAKSAGRQLNGSGVVLMLHLAVTDTVGGIEPMEGIIEMHFECLIKALVDDEQVQTEALDFLKEVRTPKDEPPPRPELSEEDKVSLIASIKKLAAVYDEHVTYQFGNASQAYRDGGANPFYNQTLNGLFFEFSYGSPSKVWTPWGEWHFAVAQLNELDLDGFMERLTLRVHSPERQTEMGCFGPVYTIQAIDGEKLPEPVLPTDRRQYLSFEVSKEEWDRLFNS